MTRKSRHLFEGGLLSFEYELTPEVYKKELTINSTSAILIHMRRTFGLILRDLRRSKNITQRELAEKVGVDFSYISKVENDRLPPPSGDTIVKIAEVLKIAPDELLALTGKMPSGVKEMLGSSPAALQFVREAGVMGLTETEWEKLRERMKRLRSE
ncbi:MAG: helix-turn-helix domain-containing protein [Spirochaetota bacterium]